MSDQRECGAQHPWLPSAGVCVKAAKHNGPHRAKAGWPGFWITWPTKWRPQNVWKNVKP